MEQSSPSRYASVFPGTPKASGKTRVLFQGLPGLGISELIAQLGPQHPDLELTDAYQPTDDVDIVVYLYCSPSEALRRLQAGHGTHYTLEHLAHLSRSFEQVLESQTCPCPVYWVNGEDSDTLLSAIRLILSEIDRAGTLASRAR